MSRETERSDETPLSEIPRAGADGKRDNRFR